MDSFSLQRQWNKPKETTHNKQQTRVGQVMAEQSTEKRQWGCMKKKKKKQTKATGSEQKREERHAKLVTGR